MAEVSQRIIPGAPPAPSSKIQRKKRKAGKKGDEDGADVHVAIPDAQDAAHVDKVTDQTDNQAGSATDGLAVDANHVASPDSATVKPASIMVDMLNKRIKNLSKKIVRILPSVHHISFKGCLFLTILVRLVSIRTATNLCWNLMMTRKRPSLLCLL